MSLLSRLRERRRARILRDHPLSDSAWEAALAGRSLFSFLDVAQRARLRELATVFAREKQFVAPDGEEPLAESDRALVAAMACLPVLNLGLDAYSGWSSIIMLAGGFMTPCSVTDSWGVTVDYEEDSAGLVMESGSVALSLDDVRQAGRGSGYNVVIHEMAHKLDDGNGDFDGLPWLDPRSGIRRGEWENVFSSAYLDFSKSLESKRRSAFKRGASMKRGAGRTGAANRAGRAARARSRLDSYAAESPSEFFAVCCEHFFETPETLRAAYPELYALLSRYFGLDPARGSAS